MGAKASEPAPKRDPGLKCHPKVCQAPPRDGPRQDPCHVHTDLWPTWSSEPRLKRPSVQPQGRGAVPRK